MSDLKTKPTDASVDAFIDAIDDPPKRDDARATARMLAEVTGAPGRMWGSSIVGFGTYRYRYASGREGEFFEAGFAPRKRALTLYVMAGFEGSDELLAGLGKFTTGKSCLYVKRLADVDADVLRELVAKSVADIRERHPD